MQLLHMKDVDRQDTNILDYNLPQTTKPQKQLALQCTSLFFGKFHGANLCDKVDLGILGVSFTCFTEDVGQHHLAPPAAESDRCDLCLGDVFPTARFWRAASIVVICMLVGW